LRAYELVYALAPNLPDEERTAQVKRFAELAKRLGCTRVQVEEWGMKRMAYEVKRFKEGYYVIMRFLGDPSAKDELDRQIKLSDEVLRHLFVRLEETQVSEEVDLDFAAEGGSQ